MRALGLEVLFKGKNLARLLGGLWVAMKISLISVGLSLPLGLLLMFRFLPSADPKANNYEKFFGFYQAFEAVFTVFMIGITWLAPLAAFGLVAMEGGIVVLLIGVGMVIDLLLGDRGSHDSGDPDIIDAL